ncbi:hypothetical protein PRIPAC_94919, partial [Pristionchus pacificus]
LIRRMTALYGTSFDDLEDEERDAVSKKPTGIQDQVATDERGRRRFHGAFTGGFSAGYFNTVGSKHGWAPSEFRSSRDERSDNSRQRAEDYMDEEDLGEFGIASRRIRQTKEFSTGSTLAWERGGETSSQSTVEGIFAKDLQIAIKPISDSIGIRMLREMGWRQGRAVGLTTIREDKKHRNLDDVDREQITKVAPHWVASAEDEEVIHLDPLEGHKGLGYSGELKGSGLLNEKYGQRAHIMKGKKGRGITGQAFGVGAFEDEDESVYTSFDLSQYDFSLGPAAPEKRNDIPDSSFVPAKSILSSRKFYGAPKLPPTFKGFHVPKNLDASVLPSRMKSLVEGMNSEQRALFLGENRQSGTGNGGRSKRKSRWDVKGEEKEDDGYGREERERRKEREESRNAERAKRVEYPRDENKQRRFMEYLNYIRRGLAMPQPADISRWEWEKEEIEFESRLLPDERALLPDVRARTKPLAKSALALPILDMMRNKFVGETNAPHMASSRDEDRLMAVKSEMFGEKTRVKFEWHPAYGLAKLFNVPNPFPGSSIHGLAHLQNKGKKREENVLSTIGLPSTAAEFAMNIGMGEDKRKDEEREDRMKEKEKEERIERRKDRDGERDRYDKDEKKRREEEEAEDKENIDDNEEEQRAPSDLLAAIFGMESSDESEDEEEKKEEGKKTTVLPSTSQPMEIPKQKGNEKEDIICIMDMEDEFGPAPPPGLNQTEGLTGFSVLRFNNEVMKKMRKRKRKIDEREKEKEREENDKKKKSKKAKKEKKSKKKHKKEKKESKSRRKSRSDSDSSSDSSVMALD